MTPPIRWIERRESIMTGLSATVRILQYQTATGEWVDVPVVGDGG